MKKRIFGIVLMIALCAALWGCAAKSDTSKEELETGDISSDLPEAELEGGEEQADMEEEAEAEKPSGESAGLLDATEEWLINSEEGVPASLRPDISNGVPPFTMILPAKSNSYTIFPGEMTRLSFGDESAPPSFQVTTACLRGISLMEHYFSDTLEEWDYDNGTYVIKAGYVTMDTCTLATFGLGNIPNERCIVVQASIDESIPMDVIVEWVKENFEHLKEQADLLPADYEPAS